jgi:nicotinate-nucleotide adenylyltransferase
MNLPDNIGKKIGILGGTFDPVHNGHIAVASAVKKELALDSILFIPAAKPPHKPGQVFSAFNDRVAMLNCSVEGQHGFFVSEIESERPEPSFTIDTLGILQNRLAHGVAFYFIIGFDAFTEIATWKEYDKLLNYTNLVVIDRPAIAEKYLDEIMENFFPGFLCDVEQSFWQKKGVHGKIYHVKMKPVSVSSTQVRGLVHNGASIEDLVPQCVQHYILTHKPYG